VWADVDNLCRKGSGTRPPAVETAASAAV